MNQVPCSRCISKKLSCQTRVSRRGQRRSLKNRTRVDGSSETTTLHRPTIDGIYMDWSHPVGHRWARSCPRGITEAARVEDPLPRSIAATHRVAQSYPANISIFPDSIQLGLVKIADNLDLSTQTRISSPPGELSGLDEMPSLDLASNKPQGNPTNSSQHGMGIMEDNFPTLSFSTSLESGLVDPNWLHDLEIWPNFQCYPMEPSSVCASTTVEHAKSLGPVLPQ